MAISKYSIITLIIGILSSILVYVVSFEVFSETISPSPIFKWSISSFLFVLLGIYFLFLPLRLRKKALEEIKTNPEKKGKYIAIIGVILPFFAILVALLLYLLIMYAFSRGGSWFS